MHILLIVNHYPLPGEVHRGVKFKQHVKYYKKAGHQVTVLAAEQRFEKNVVSHLLDNIKKRRFYSTENNENTYIYRNYSAQLLVKTWALKCLKALGLNGSKLKAKHTARLYQTIKNAHGTPDIIHAHGSQWSGACAYMIHKRFYIPYVLTEHMSIYQRDLVNPKDMPFMREIFKNASYTFPVSEELKTTLDQKLGNNVISQCMALPNMLDPELFELAETNDKEKQNFIFFSVSRLVKIKRFDIMLEAFAQKFAEKVEYELRIGGDGECAEKLQALAKELKIEKQVTFLGALNRQDVVREMQACNAYLLSSDYETFGIPLIEAGFCGKPAISTDVAGPKGIICDEVGVLIPKGDINAFGAAMEKMSKSIENYSPSAIRSYYLEKYSAPNIVKQLSDIYQTIKS